jgi:hypothetical protein
MLLRENKLFELEELIECDIVERYQMKYLIETFPKFRKLKEYNKQFLDAHIMFFSLGMENITQ